MKVSDDTNSSLLEPESFHDEDSRSLDTSINTTFETFTPPPEKHPVTTSSKKVVVLLCPYMSIVCYLFMFFFFYEENFIFCLSFISVFIMQRNSYFVCHSFLFLFWKEIQILFVLNFCFYYAEKFMSLNWLVKVDIKMFNHRQICGKLFILSIIYVIDICVFFSVESSFTYCTIWKIKILN
jgi:hypothetical protein